MAFQIIDCLLNGFLRLTKKEKRCIYDPLWGESPWFVIVMPLFVKLEELHILTARKPLIHQNQPVAQYLHKIQPCML